MAGQASLKSLKQIIPPSQLVGEITVPGDKSISHRALILCSLAQGKSQITDISPGKDCLSTMSCLKALGVKLIEKDRKSSTLLINGVGKTGLTESRDVLNAGNSGTTIRLMGGLLASQPFLSIITGDVSLRSRPMKRLIEPLRLMGAEIYGGNNDSLAPLVIRGTQLHGMNYKLPVPSAQIKSAILLAGLFAQGNTVLEQPMPSRDHTERLLQYMGAQISSNDEYISLKPLKDQLAAVDLKVPGDISSAAFWLVAGAIHPNAKIKILNCGINPTRTGIIDVLLTMGARLQIENKRSEGNEPVADLNIASSRLRGIEIGGELIPRLIDEIPLLALAGCFANGKTIIRDAGELRVKESDRIISTSQELIRLGARIDELPDGMIIYGRRSLVGNEVQSHHDHRLAMSLAIAGLVARGTTSIHNARVADISNPNFWEELKVMARY
jgi:3-phosphoshikimate 1-carboxyvinyltransferase